MKKCALILMLTALFAGGMLQADQVLTGHIEKGNWDRLAALFSDDSYRVLKDNFTGCGGMETALLKPGRILYRALFPDRGEIGIITFEKRAGKYGGLKLRNRVKPLYSIQGFRKYRAVDVKFTQGDARVHFKDGYIYESLPYSSLVLFSGDWEFYIKPGDAEERLTLQRLFEKDFFSRAARTGLFILEDRAFLKGLTAVGEGGDLDPALLSLFTMYREMYAIHVPQFGEYWYPAFSQDLDLVVFEKEEGGHYYYTFSRSQVPDTQLAEGNDRRLLLSYNAREGMVVQLGKEEEVERLELDIELDPGKKSIAGRAAISYGEPASMRELELKKGIDLQEKIERNAQDINMFRRGKKYYVLTPYGKSLDLRFSGRVEPVTGYYEFFRSLEELPPGLDWTGRGRLYYFSRTQDFYPDPGDSFFASRVTLCVPPGLNGLAPGNRVGGDKKKAGCVTFESAGTHGISLVLGAFKKTRMLKSRLPVNIYTFPGFEFPRKFDLKEIGDGADFFLTHFGSPGLSAVNLLFNWSPVEGGISNHGFIVIHLLPVKNKKDYFKSKSKNKQSFDKKVLPPSLIRNRGEDCVLHELAHQWWGGMISGKTYQDTWITEGLAHFSVLYYLKHQLPDKKFQRLVKKLTRWVSRYAGCGPVIYGPRVHMLEKDYEAYQSIVYNKGALVFLILLDMIGEEELVMRLRSVLEAYKYRTVSSMQFIRKFCAGDPLLLDFFKGWIYTRKLPELTFDLLLDDPEYDRINLGTVVLMARQLDTSLVFPLRLRVRTTKGFSDENLVIRSREQRVVVTRDSAIQSITLGDNTAPVKEKK